MDFHVIQTKPVFFWVFRTPGGVLPRFNSERFTLYSGVQGLDTEIQLLGKVALGLMKNSGLPVQKDYSLVLSKMKQYFDNADYIPIKANGEWRDLSELGNQGSLSKIVFAEVGNLFVNMMTVIGILAIVIALLCYQTCILTRRLRELEVKIVFQPIPTAGKIEEVLDANTLP